MPTYSYKCPDCGNEKDIFKPMSESDRVEACTICMLVDMVKQPSAPMVSMGVEMNMLKKAVDKVGKDAEGLNRNLVGNGVTFAKPTRPSIKS